MNFTLNQLQIFLKVVETASVTKAAVELHLSQPAVSIQLRNFQEQFDIPLTEVVGRRLYVTDFGREIATAAEQILAQVHAINFRTMAFKGQLTGRLRLSVVSTGKYIMPWFLSDFMRGHPGVELSMDVTNKARVIESLEQNEVDFSLVSIPPSGLPVDRLDLLQNKLFLVGHGDAALPTGKTPHLVFRDLPLIFREKGSGTRQTMEGYIREHNLSVLEKMELTSNEAVKQAVMAGLGYSIMPLIGIRNELRNGQLRIIPVKGLPVTTMWSLTWLKSKRHSPVALAFLDHVRNEKDRVVHSRFDGYENYV